MKNSYPSLKNCTYLNTAYCGIFSDSMVEWRIKTDQLYSENADYYKSIQAVEMEKHAQQQVSKLMNASLSETFLATSCSAGLQAFLFKIPKHYNFLLLKDDYPSITDMVVDHQFNYTEIPLQKDVEEAVLSELRNKNFEVFLFSAVQYNSGLLFDMDFLKTIKKEFPDIIILVDGTQFIANVHFDFNKSVVDGIFVSGYKWLLAGHGNGFMCLKESLLSRLKLSSKDIINLLDRGHRAPLAMGSLGFAIEELLSHGLERVFESNRSLGQYLFNALNKRALLEEFVALRKEHSSIFTLIIGKDIFDFLIKNNIRCVQRGLGVRVSLHFYNTKEDVDYLLKTLDQALK